MKSANFRFRYFFSIVDNGPLAQLAERGADNAKVVSSNLTWTKVSQRLLLVSFGADFNCWSLLRPQFFCRPVGPVA